MGDMGDDFRAWTEYKKAKRRSNTEYSTKLLQGIGVKFESKNLGSHLIIEGKECLIDFWPSTGKFIPRDGTKKGRGVNNLLKHCHLPTSKPT